MMMAGGGGAPIADLPLGALINIGTDGGAGTPNYEIADEDNLVSGGVVLVRKNIHSNSPFGRLTTYPGGTLDSKMTSIYNSYPETLKSKIMDATFALRESGSITRKVFAPTYTMVGFGVNSGVTEGKALQLYKSNASRIKILDGEAGRWFLSSFGNADLTQIVYTDGTSYVARPDDRFGVVPTFVIPSKTSYDPTPNTDGSYNLIL
jgi:hypothetical protein